jgi:ribosomal protein S27AE
MTNPHDVVYQAIRRGELVRQPCEVCGATKVHAHHDDYSKPLDVRWLCSRHHRLHHGAMLGPRKLTENIRVRVSKEQLAALEVLADREDRSVGALARRAINDLLTKDGKESP